ncbi:hypothetical protein AVEN_45842-1 [Araneus ventricosus]|uniref:Uncharacterized protein n=1 Tax=Araneus ventricosus TaxID=182803 RepID=A0A4Y2Q283_ARAVE|nr:hypothetical protein AVEN_45842-1 [Araneus ventricosus]
MHHRVTCTTSRSRLNATSGSVCHWWLTPGYPKGWYQKPQNLWFVMQLITISLWSVHTFADCHLMANHRLASAYCEQKPSDGTSTDEIIRSL